MAQPETKPRQSNWMLWAVSLTALLLSLAGLSLLNPKMFPAAEDQPDLSGSNPTNQGTAEGLANLAVLPGRPGPWGELEYTRITIEPPDEFVYFNDASQHGTRWFFGFESTQKIAEALLPLGLAPAGISELTHPARCRPVEGGFETAPTPEFVLNIPGETRNQLYDLLAGWSQNYLHENPYSFHVDDLEERFRESGLQESTVDRVKKLLYRRGMSYCFSDLPILLGELTSKAEKERLVKTLSRHPTVLMKLRIHAKTDVPALVRYWGKGGRAKDIQPLLESLTRVPDGTSIDVAHLMPPFARMLLFTFPYPSRDPAVSKRNCFWTALNFFNERPDDRFCEASHTEQVLQEDYYPIQNEPVYGDVILLLDQRESVVHAAVYLADNMVFTKNGRHFTEPWRIMRVEDMLAEYPASEPMRPVIYRSKRL